MLSLVVNILRSLPFIILLIVMIPFTVLITGTSLGVAGAIPPLVVGATPFFARLVETALREVDRGIIEATQSMGATTRQIITNALLPEARPGIFAAITVTAITWCPTRRWPVWSAPVVWVTWRSVSATSVSRPT
jgi:D-methionine transport system permease protein